MPSEHFLCDHQVIASPLQRFETLTMTSGNAPFEVRNWRQVAFAVILSRAPKLDGLKPSSLHRAKPLRIPACLIFNNHLTFRERVPGYASVILVALAFAVVILKRR